MKFCFPLKYPDSAVRATIEMRTVIGQRSHDHNVVVDPQKEAFRKIRTSRASSASRSAKSDSSSNSASSSDNEEVPEPSG
eukprot:CAMPEP_0197904690 /NCGR_PEP_ID=MMETSP1439-20131203/58596_1 /TAXON_ID=66791 /ORGANISM="Gonyaulax spinifera, Strain CCMP409" /LENGTH=79 /DNA_ID=CAMNT_0043525901 /DNA_START=18 /DNA_END=257 /DNA_ORIENTATION=+